MSRPRHRHAAVVAGAVAAIAGTVAPGVHRASADPPGFPSKGSAAQPAQPTTSPASTDDFVRNQIAALKKFSHDKENDPAFAEHEGPDHACRIDHDQHVVTLTFNADGTLHCKLAEVGEGYELDVWVLTIKGVYDTGNHYRVTVATGAALSFAPIHGTSADVKAELAVLSGLNAEATEAAWWHAKSHYGPYHFDSATMTIALDECAVSQDTKLTIVPLYRFALTVLVLAGPGVPGYSVADGKIAQSGNRADLAYYFGVHLFPFSWHRDGKKHTLPGRYFSDDYSDWYDRISVVAGADIAHPTEGGYVGGAIEVYGGVSITAGWQPRKYNRLQTGYAVGDMFMGAQVPTDSVWKLSGWAAGISVDASLLKTLLAYIGK